MTKEATKTLLMSFDDFVFWCAPCYHCKDVQQIPKAGPYGEARTMIDCTEPEKCLFEYEHRLKARREYEEFLMRKEEICGWADNPEPDPDLELDSLLTPYGRYEDIVAEATGRRPTKSNCLFRV